MGLGTLRGRYNILPIVRDVEVTERLSVATTGTMSLGHLTLQLPSLGLTRTGSTVLYCIVLSGEVSCSVALTPDTSLIR
jgi:hypothetical protein